MINDHLELPSALRKYVQLRPQARASFKNTLRQQVVATRVFSEPTQTTSPKSRFIFSIPKKWVFVSMALVIVVLLTLISRQPAWSKMQERIRRFFMITKIEHSIPTTTEFWSTLSSNEVIPSLPYMPSASNAFIPQEELRQKSPPSGFATVADYIVVTYHLHTYSSLTDILSHTPAKIIREEPYYMTGKLYVLEFPEGLISYTELEVAASSTISTTIRTIR